MALATCGEEVPTRNGNKETDRALLPNVSVSPNIQIMFPVLINFTLVQIAFHHTTPHHYFSLVDCFTISAMKLDML